MLKFSQDTRNFCYQIVNAHSSFNRDKFYSLDISDVPDFLTFELCSKIMLDNPGYASECMSEENSFYQDVLDDLCGHLKDISSRDNEIKFLISIRHAIYYYQIPVIKKLLKEALDEYNIEQGCVSDEDFGVRRDTAQDHHPWAA